MSDPVSWLLIEKGWRVLAADGTEVGRVDEVVGDTGKDIFNGLAISTGLFARRRYVPSEQVGTIVEGAVTLQRTAEQVEHLGDFADPPPSHEVLPP